MVGTHPAVSAPGVAEIQAHLREQADRFVRFDHTRGSVTVDFGRMATLVAEIATVHTSAVRAVNDHLIGEIVSLETDTATAHAERAGLWQLLRAQTRNARDLRARAAHWRVVATGLRAEVARWDREVREALGATEHTARSCAELAADLRADRDGWRGEAELREDEIVSLGYGLEKAEDRLADVEARLAEQRAERGAA